MEQRLIFLIYVLLAAALNGRRVTCRVTGSSLHEILYAETESL